MSRVGENVWCWSTRWWWTVSSAVTAVDQPHPLPWCASSTWQADGFMLSSLPLPLLLQTGCEAEPLYHIRLLAANVTGGRLVVTCLQVFSVATDFESVKAFRASDAALTSSLNSLFFSLLCSSLVLEKIIFFIPVCHIMTQEKKGVWSQTRQERN